MKKQDESESSIFNRSESPSIRRKWRALAGFVALSIFSIIAFQNCSSGFQMSPGLLGQSSNQTSPSDGSNESDASNGSDGESNDGAGDGGEDTGGGVGSGSGSGSGSQNPIGVQEPFTTNSNSIQVAAVDLLGSDLTISGSGFRAFTDSHASAEHLVSVWDDFESGTFSNPFGTWRVDTPTTNILMRRPSTLRTRENNSYLMHMNNNGLGGIEWDTENRRVYYFSHWIRMSEVFDVCGGTSHQWKFVRFYSNSLSDGSAGINIYPNVNCTYATLGMSVEHHRPQITDGRESKSKVAYASLLGKWIRLDVKIVKSSSANTYDGQLQMMINNQVIYDFTRDTGKLNPTKYPAPYGINTGASDLANFMSVGSYSNGASENTYIDFDDIYYANTQARVELCDKASLQESTHCEIQIPQSWSDSEIQLKFNQGSFSSGSEAYLFVITEQNETHAIGRRITVP